MIAVNTGRWWALAGAAGMALLGPLQVTAAPAVTRVAAKAPSPAAARIDLDALTNETQKGSPGADDATLVWWIPEEFWRGSLASSGGMSAAQLEAFVNVVRPYTVVIVADGKVGPVGGITYKPEAAIRSAIKVRDSEGGLHAPLDMSAVTADARNLLAAMKPVLENALGPAGKNMHFFVFPGKSKKGHPIGSARAAGTFTVLLGERDFRWRLPLASLLPPKACPTCSEKLSGAFKFCPWDAAKLP